MKLAIMQPYIFPYIGYFQLINTVDTFVFYDDVNFIKKGFINKNNILVQGIPSSFNISCKKISQNKTIHETELNFDLKAATKLLLTIEYNYKNAPYFKEIFPCLKDFFLNNKRKYISNLAADSILLVTKYLKIKTKFKFSSIEHQDTRTLKAEDRIIAICKKEKATQYINSIGGLKLYDKSNFLKNNIKLNFLQTNVITYKQLDNDFVPWLSIIDVLMFNSKEEIRKMLKDFKME